MQNPMQMIQAFNQFRSTFSGDPKAEVQKLMQSGQMSQAQFNQLQAMATLGIVTHPEEECTMCEAITPEVTDTATETEWIRLLGRWNPS